MKGSAVALFSVNPMYSINFMSVKVMLHCTVVHEFYGKHRRREKCPLRSSFPVKSYLTEHGFYEHFLKSNALRLQHTTRTGLNLTEVMWSLKERNLAWLSWKAFECQETQDWSNLIRRENHCWLVNSVPVIWVEVVGGVIGVCPGGTELDSKYVANNFGGTRLERL